MHIHSYYSFYNSTLSIEEIFSFAKEKNFKFLSLTDENLSVAPIFYKKCLEEKIKPIIGFCFDCKFYTIAKNYEGLKSLYRISTKLSLKKDLFSALKEEKESPLWFFVSSKEYLNEILKIFKREDIWLEIDPKNKDYEILKYNLPFVYGKAVKLKESSEEKILKVLWAIKNLTNTGKIEKYSNFQNLDFFQVEEEFEKLFYKKIDEINIEIPLNKLNLPFYPFLKEEEKFPFLFEILKKKFEEKYKKDDLKAKLRLEYELKTVKEMGFLDYFLIVWDIVERAKREGIHTLGRGSAASSIISFLLDITPVDPIKEDLYFERFLNPYRKSPPDIDLDFGTSKRDEILNYIYKTYGEENVAMISTSVKYSLRGALRDLAKAKGLSEEEIIKITKFLPYEDLDLNTLIKKYPECKILPFKSPNFKEIYNSSLKITHFPKGFGIHCGGIVISPEPLTCFLALTPSANGRVITQPDMYGIDELGLLKLDILGNRSLDVLPFVLSKIDEPLPELDKILKDEKTKKLIREGETIGCFYIESPAMRQLLKKLKVEDFQSMVIATSIIRPGVAESGMMQAYIRRHLGKEKPVFVLPELEEILKKTYGVMVYQEDVIKVANKIASLSLSEADAFRKAMSGKSRSKEEMEKALNLFIEKALEKGCPKDAVKEMARQISSFAGYAFCKAHSAAFSTLSFKMAYLKSYYPEIFLSSVLNFGGGFYPPIVYIREAKRLGIEVLPPLINEAEIDYKVEKNKIIVGFKAVKNLSKKTQEKILKERSFKKFNSFLDFYSRVMPEKNEVESLIKTGSFDFFGYKRKELFWLLNFGIKGNALGFVSKEMEKEILSRIPDIEETREEKAFMEWECLGFPLTAHPVEFVRNGLKVFAKDLKNYIGKKISIPALILFSKKIWVEKQKGWMKFLTLEDETDFFEGVIFPKNYEKYVIFTKKVGPHIFEGVVKDDSGCLSFEIEKVCDTGEATGV